MPKFLAVLVLLGILTVPAAAQKAENYRLRQLSAQGYLTGLSHIVAQADDQARLAILESLAARFPETEIFTQNFELLAEIYAGLAINTDYFLVHYVEQWLLALVQAGLTQTPTDFSQTKAITFKHQSASGLLEIGLETEPHDFDGDGQDEYLLKVSDSDNIQLYLTAQVDPRQPSGYQLKFTPLPFIANNYPNSSSNTGNLKTLDFRDLNADGLPEWQVLHDGYGNWSNDGKRYILAWRQNQLTDLAETLFDYRIDFSDQPPHWTDTEQNGRTQIEMRVVYTDGWGCSWTVIDRLNWTPAAKAERQTEYANTLPCILHQAEPLMQTGDYDAAIPVYEQGLNLPSANPDVKQY
ncbi:MAG TPA: hypothetical protein VHO69_11800, partial [Phototrophicaceae bacterium]|nr:hypothetical protein [Phototrophicaceae bacterium]